MLGSHGVPAYRAAQHGWSGSAGGFVTKNSCEWTVHSYCLNQPAPDEGSVNLFLLMTGWSPALDLSFGGPLRHTYKEAIAEVIIANSEAFMLHVKL